LTRAAGVRGGLQGIFQVVLGVDGGLATKSAEGVYTGGADEPTS
jgi:hypothetical protein